MTRQYLKDDSGYSIVLLNRAMGLPIVGHLQTWMVHFIDTIRTIEMPLDWATVFSDNLDEQLILVKIDPHFYITSYMVYLLVA